MKKTILTLMVLVVGVVSYAQNSAETPQRLKYITTAPDGSIAMIITDDTNKSDIKLESANNFYRYEVLDLITGEAVLASRNQGKECTIEKNKLASGTYNLRLYTSKFVITSEVVINNTESSAGIVG